MARKTHGNWQARLATKAYLKRRLELSLTEAEEKSIAHLQARKEPEQKIPHLEAPISFNGRKEARRIRIEIQGDLVGESGGRSFANTMHPIHWQRL